MTASRNRTRLGLEQIEDRCTPSAVLDDFAGLLPAPRGGPHAVAAHTRPAHEHAIPIKVIEQCSADISTGKASTTGFATVLGRFTGEGRVTNAHVDQQADLATIRGTLTIVTARGDKLFVTFESTWKLSTGQGTESITVHGGTGRFAGASGGGTLDCKITQDPASPTKFNCQCVGSGTLILAHRQGHDSGDDCRDDDRRDGSHRPFGDHDRANDRNRDGDRDERRFAGGFGRRWA
jgi:hypothetical protein